MLPYLTALFVYFDGEMALAACVLRATTRKVHPGDLAGWRIFWPRNDLVPLLRWRRHCYRLIHISYCMPVITKFRSPTENCAGCRQSRFMATTALSDMWVTRYYVVYVQRRKRCNSMKEWINDWMSKHGNELQYATSCDMNCCNLPDSKKYETTQ